MQSFRLFLVVSSVPRRAVALPLSYTPAGTARAYIPLVVISISLFIVVFVFIAIKLVYMEHRRMGTIHAPPGITARSIPISSHHSSTWNFGIRDKQENRHRGLLVGFLGSPAWETNVTSKLNRAVWRRERRRGYQLPTGSTMRSSRSGSTRSKSENLTLRSHLTKSIILTRHSNDEDRPILASSSGCSRTLTARRISGSVKRNALTKCYSCCGDFGEFHEARSPRVGIPQAARRASPSSIRLVDGPGHSNPVEYSFLCGLPPSAIAVSPLMGTRDSIQLSRCLLKCHRKPVPPLPSLPLFLPFRLPDVPDATQAAEYLPSLRFSPLASAVRTFYSQQQAPKEEASTNRVADPGRSQHAVDSSISRSVSMSSALSRTPVASSCVIQEIPPLRPRRTNVKSNHKRSQSCKGLAITGSSPQEDEKCGNVAATPTGFVSVSSGSSVSSKKPLKSCLRQHSLVIPTPSMSETSTRRSTMGDQASLRTPISEMDIGILGLDQFHWNEDEVKELMVRPCHLKQDSIALVPVWE